jgi:hypothetical protein
MSPQTTIAQPGTATAVSKQVGGKTGIRPFRATFPEAELTELRRRVNATKWPDRETVPDATQGV